MVKGQRMKEITFDLGKNIIETAASSGVPKFSADNIDGYISYSVMPVPAEVPVRFVRRNMEIVWQPVFAFVMRADEKRFADRRVESARLSLNSELKTHAAAQAFIVQTISQFRRGQWRRYCDPVWATLLTGRSSILDEDGNIAPIQMTIDPEYDISPADWVVVTKKGARWQWAGDGVLADLSARYDGGIDSDLEYRISIEFSLLDVLLQRNAENEANELKAGDAKGWGSTVRNEADKKERVERNKRLEANAIKRGDSVVPKP